MFSKKEISWNNQITSLLKENARLFEELESVKVKLRDEVESFTVKEREIRTNLEIQLKNKLAKSYWTLETEFSNSVKHNWKLKAQN